MKKFSTSFNGYSKLEVNNFVNEVTLEYDKMLSKLKNQDIEINNLKQELEKYKNMESTLNRAIMIAEDTTNQIKKVARDEARGVIDDARRNASRIVNDALLKATKIEQDAEVLKRRVSVFKRRLRNVVDEQIEFIESIDEDY